MKRNISAEVIFPSLRDVRQETSRCSPSRAFISLALSPRRPVQSTAFPTFPRPEPHPARPQTQTPIASTTTPVHPPGTLPPSRHRDHHPSNLRLSTRNKNKERRRPRFTRCPSGKKEPPKTVVRPRIPGDRRVGPRALSTALRRPTGVVAWRLVLVLMVPSGTETRRCAGAERAWDGGLHTVGMSPGRLSGD